MSDETLDNGNIEILDSGTKDNFNEGSNGEFTVEKIKEAEESSNKFKEYAKRDFCILLKYKFYRKLD